MPLAATEARHPAAKGLQDRPLAEAAAALAEAQVAAAAAVRAALPAIAEAAEAAATTLETGGRLAYAGAGSSGVMALADALELPGTFGLAPHRAPVLLAGGAATLLHMTGAVEDDPAAAAAGVARLGLGPADALVAVSASGATPYTLAAAEAARAAGCTVIAVANVAGSPLLRLAARPVLLDTGAEVVAGSTRMGAATAQKIALNMISTLAALRLGHVHDGLMINLVADNAKLRARAARIVAELAGVTPEAGEAALADAGGAVKPAILLAAGASDPAGRLAAAQGRLGPALAALHR
ncbi:N-acetylmuramic acid 6-phosphate etherase [Amaricoccus sp.]|uniref:N-acetylmuramic acid 6-phosphate etherase n=1 Tax=Amaricoccus sp. TaxID=1872485 RepID=UPI001B63A949|nr:N-acetylmuramic acid 6-phosphate etherase [Amaricoccus sp.]MBP7002864.1 N-acetylmuramic acid 6-phosphate etherase [Amaricoccus sp.]